MRSPAWSPEEIAYLRANVGKQEHTEIAAHLGRTWSAVKNYANVHGITTRRAWTEAEREYVRQHFRKIPAKQIGEKIGRSARSVWDEARHLGLAVPQRIKAPDFIAFLKEKNAEGWTDSEISRARRVDRHAVAHLRRQLCLPCNAFSERRRRAVAAKTAEQLRRAGLSSIGQLRVVAFRERARLAGWPEDLRPRAVQMLNAMWDNGPMTRRQLADAIGMPWKGSRKSLVSNDPEGSYLAHLMARGLVVCLGRKIKGKGKGHSVNLYTLPLWIERKQPA